MWFSKKINNNSEFEQRLKSANEALYKHSVELAEKNKTFSLLRKLYDISILALTSKELASRITTVLRADLNFELAGIFLYNQKDNEMVPLAFSLSDRMKKVEREFERSFERTFITRVTSIPMLKDILNDKEMHHTPEMADIWDTSFSEGMFRKINEEGHVKSTVMYPLLVENKSLGIITLCFNRSYDDLVTYEKESINSFVEVTAVALDKAMLYEQLTIANARLMELDQQKTEFISLATHQIRGPLGVIKGHASLALEGDYGEISKGHKKVFETILNAAQDLVVVVGDYLDVSRIEQGKMKYEFSDFDLKGLAETVVSDYQATIDSSKLVLVFNSNPDAYFIRADRGKIKQVLSNLLDNSIKYTPQGSIHVELLKKNDKVILSIKDTGIGIRNDVIPYLFAKFSRAPDANKTNIIGTGLGLFVAKKMIEAHNGRIWAESDGENKGAQFYIELDEKK